jgi:hypothetical protein
MDSTENAGATPQTLPHDHRPPTLPAYTTRAQNALSLPQPVLSAARSSE